MCSPDESLSESHPAMLLFHVLNCTLVLFSFLPSSANYTEANSMALSEASHKDFLKK